MGVQGAKRWSTHLLLTKIENPRLSYSLSSNQKGSSSTFTFGTSSHGGPPFDAPPTTQRRHGHHLRSMTAQSSAKNETIWRLSHFPNARATTATPRSRPHQLPDSLEPLSTTLNPTRSVASAVLQDYQTSSRASHIVFGSYATKPYCRARNYDRSHYHSVRSDSDSPVALF
ncbi:hypothetical protein DEO72_LG11g1961 [Vigna unguiculata]|uniref:Uncharacterized protein n=1 Tax=Vigna unguiculata TaxID=3917 RepID=A0A4D6NM99_VIGUN|nr:hypothetical protein DEO72_LG11g1961 [Vigna unguiculata]